MLGQRDEPAIVDDMALIVLAGDRGLHPVIEDLQRHAADRLEGLHMAAQQRLQILVQHIAAKQEARMTEHQAEQPDDLATLAGTEAFQRSCNERRKIEMRFAHLKAHHGFNRLRLRGLTGARDEFRLAAIAQNLKTLATRTA
jgi:hypothetical protein